MHDFVTCQSSQAAAELIEDVTFLDPTDPNYQESAGQYDNMTKLWSGRDPLKHLTE